MFTSKDLGAVLDVNECSFTLSSVDSSIERYPSQMLMHRDLTLPIPGL